MYSYINIDLLRVVNFNTRLVALLICQITRDKALVVALARDRITDVMLTFKVWLYYFFRLINILTEKVSELNSKLVLNI